MARRPRLRRHRGSSRTAKQDLLSGVPLFSACGKRELARIASLADELEVSEGKVLMRQGESGRECFVVAEGRAKAKMRGKKRSRTLGPGSVIGEMALLDQGPRSATVTADTDMRLLVLDSRSFSSMLEELPSVSRRILRTMAERVRDAESDRPEH